MTEDGLGLKSRGEPRFWLALAGSLRDCCYSSLVFACERPRVGRVFRAPSTNFFHRFATSLRTCLHLQRCLNILILFAFFTHLLLRLHHDSMTPFDDSFTPLRQTHCIRLAFSVYPLHLTRTHATSQERSAIRTVLQEECDPSQEKCSEKEEEDGTTTSELCNPQKKPPLGAEGVLPRE